MPTDADVQTMETRLSRIAQLHYPTGNKNDHIEHPDRYYRQYLGILIGKHKLIYINAFCDDPPPKDWKQRELVVFDGGACFWNVIYDFASGEFSNLQINGVA
jgi:hypothetical protein